MFEKILFPTDFSEPSKKAFGYLEKIRKECNSKTVILLHVISKHEINTLADFEGFSSLKIEELRDEIERQLTLSAEEKLNELEKELHKWGFDVEQRILVGTPAEEIVNEAKKEQVGVIVMGAHGKGVIEEIIIGSVSEKVLRRAPCPVLILR